jgi:hypothetical protein
MSLGVCQLSECTFNVTRQCVQGYPTDECPNRAGASASRPPAAVNAIADSEKDEKKIIETDAAETLGAEALGGAVLERPAETPRLPTSGTLGIVEANALMEDRYTNLVGIVGLPGSGKTACLASIYLLLAKGQFVGFSYTDSRTLMAFEEIARGSRRWNNGDMPNQMNVHTEMADDREAGFLHLRVRRDADGRLYDLLLPDLPGEWSKALIDRKDAARFEFLKSASVIWLMVDGRQFLELQTRHYATYRAQCLLERLSDFLPRPRPRIMLVPSWRDIGEFPDGPLGQIQEEGRKWGMEITLASIASFSQNDDVNPGEGLVTLIERTVTHDRVAPDFWPEEVQSSDARALLGYRSTR